MRSEIHPEYKEITIQCSCGNKFNSRTTLSASQMNIEVCNECHPFYTGKQKILDTGGRVAAFERRYGKKA